MGEQRTTTKVHGQQVGQQALSMQQQEEEQAGLGLAWVGAAREGGPFLRLLHGGADSHEARGVRSSIARCVGHVFVHRFNTACT